MGPRTARNATICASLILAAPGAFVSPLQTSHVSGRLKTSDGRMLLSGAVMMAPIDDRAASNPANEIRIFPDGQFSFGGVAPGRYQIRARGQTQTNGPALFATFGLVVDGRDITNIEMTLRPGAILNGQVVLERRHAPRSLSLTSLTVRAPLVDGSGFGDAITGRVRRDGSFQIRGLIAGRHHVMVEGVPESWILETVFLRGHDITDQPFDVAEEQQLQDVRVVLTDGGSDVSGRVRDAHDQPAPDAAVLVFSVSPQYWIPGGRRLRLLRTNTDGGFTLAGLPPGAYLAIAAKAVDESLIGRTQFLEQLRDAATPFSITAGEARVTLDLRIVRDTLRHPPAR